MYLSELRIWNFRKFGTIKNDDKEDKPGLDLIFKPGFNLIVGENDSGKTAIIDAIKFVLLTQSYETLKLEHDDFYIPRNSISEDERAKEIKIECILRDIKNEEAKNFIEWLGIEKNKSGENQYFLKVSLKAKREARRIFYDIKAGADEEGSQLDGKARDLLRTTYLKPLRDAELELNPKRSSRLSQILESHDTFNDKDKHPIMEVIAAANESIKQYFKGLDAEGNKIDDERGKTLLEDINNYLYEFSCETEPLCSDFAIADVKLRAILEKLSLNLADNKPGLGSHNLLFIATEFLLLKREDYSGLKLALIEEIEAHLHPQAQLRLIDYLQKESAESKIQLILTTHSPNLASKAALENIIICKNGQTLPLGNEYTELEVGDYLFLQRFLDVTKANLFFAQGVILVEGDAENILLPTIADVIALPLSKYGVSIVNVGSTAFLRYSRIFIRKDATKLMDTPVACITDCDVKPDLYKQIKNDSKTLTDYPDGIEGERNRKQNLYNKQNVKTFVSPNWTLEYDIALSIFQEEFYKALLCAKAIEGSDKYGLTEDKKKDIEKKVQDDLVQWNTSGWTKEKIAFEIYNNIMLNPTNKVSKAVCAQCLANIFNEYKDKKELKKKMLSDDKISYLINAIKYASGIKGGYNV